MEKPTSEQIIDWYSSPVTKYVVNEINETVEEIKRIWVDGGFTGNNDYDTIQLNSRALGSAQELLNLKDFIETLLEEDDNDKDAT